MIYSGTNRGPFKNKQARADFIQESFQSITDKKRYSSMGFVRQQPCCLTYKCGGNKVRARVQRNQYGVKREMKDTMITLLYATSLQ